MKIKAFQEQAGMEGRFADYNHIDLFIHIVYKAAFDY